MKKFWEFKALADKKAGELYLYGEISDISWMDDTVTPAKFQSEMSALGDIKNLNIYVNSPGGDVFAGIAIFSMLKRHKAYKTVYIDGIAASAASVLAMAGNKIVMLKGTMQMIHNAWAAVVGNRDDHEAIVSVLDRIDEQLADIYSERTGKSKEDIKKWMSAERWMTGEEAVSDGFADAIEEGKQIAACADTEKYFARYKNPPNLKPAEPTTPEAANKGGFLLPKPADNGDESQPVADINEYDQQDALKEQRKQLYRMKNKLYGGKKNG